MRVPDSLIGEKLIIGEEHRGPMTTPRGVMDSTSGVTIPLTILLVGEQFKLREFVITTALKSEDRPLTRQEEDRIIEVIQALRDEYPECWKFKSGTEKCREILRAATTLINLLKRHPLQGRKREIDDLKRWLEYGKKL